MRGKGRCNQHRDAWNRNKPGEFISQVAALKLVTADGQVLTCSPDRHPEELQATRVSLGVLEIVAWIDLQVVPVHYLRYRSARMPLHQCLEQLDYYNQTHPHFEFFWFPHTDRVHVKNGWIGRSHSRCQPGLGSRGKHGPIF
jgi:hypothetical protein